jgi:hypothetical protein
MKNIFFAGLLGGVILFVWGALAWIVLPLHTPSLHVMPNEDSVMAAMKAGLDKKGVYFFPGKPSPTGDAQLDKAAEDAWTAKYSAGPVGIVIYDPSGAPPGEAGIMIVGFINGVLAAFVAAWLLSRSTAAVSTYLARVAFCGLLGIFASLVTHVVNWNWLNYPADFTTGMIADTVIGWVLAGLGIGAIVKTGTKSEA